MNPHELIHLQNAVVPNYSLENRITAFEIYISHLEELCIIGRVDGNYICGLSFSTVSDLERTQTIVNGMMNTANPLLSQEYKVLGDRYHEVHDWYKLYVPHTEYNGEMKFHIPEDCHFAIGYMAERIKHNYQVMYSLCEARLKDGLYIPVLHLYHQLLTKFKRGESETPSYYHQMKPFINIIGKESYLKLSHDSAVRALYLSIEKAANNLYGAYMDVAR